MASLRDRQIGKIRIQIYVVICCDVFNFYTQNFEFYSLIAMK